MATGTCAINLWLLWRHVMQGMTSFPVNYSARRGRAVTPIDTSGVRGTDNAVARVGWVEKADHAALNGRSSCAMTPQSDGRGSPPATWTSACDTGRLVTGRAVLSDVFERAEAP